MLVIYDKVKNYYFQYKDQVIVFDDMDKVNWFLNAFYTYAVQRCEQEDPFLIPQVMMSQNNLSIEEPNFDMTKVQIINFNDLTKN